MFDPKSDAEILNDIRVGADLFAAHGIYPSLGSGLGLLAILTGMPRWMLEDCYGG